MVALAATIGVAWAAPARALDLSRHLSQYAHATWRPQDRFLGGWLVSVAQTTDGYLWIGTKTGLLRFDGIRFVPWQSRRGERLPSTDILGLVAAGDGSLWVGTRGGLSRWKDDTLTTYTHLPVGSVIEARDSTIWFTQVTTADTETPLCHIVQERVQCYGEQDGMPSIRVGVPLLEDDAGSFLIGSDTALIRWSPQSHDVYRPAALRSNANIDGLLALARTPDATLWVGIGKAGPQLGLQRVSGGRWAALVTPHFDSSRLTVTSLLVDHTGSLWVGTVGQGLYRIHGVDVEHFGRVDGLSSDSVFGFCEDREGTLWVSTSDGLDNFRDVPIISVTTHDGLSSAEIDSVTASKRGGVWIGEAGALDYMQDGVVSSVRAGRGLPGNQVAALFEDDAGQLWVGVDNDLFTYADGRFRKIVRRGDVSTGLVLGLAEDRDRNIWAEVAGPPRSLLRIRGTTVQQEFAAPQTPAARRVAVDPRGGLWLGLNDGDLAHFDQGTHVRYHFDHDAGARVLQLVPFEDGSVLAATTYGVVGWRQGHTVTLTERNGVPCNRTFGIVMGASGSLVLDTECGLVAVAERNFQDWWNGHAAAVTTTVFDRFDGAHPEQVAFEAAARSVDGRFWFASGDRLQMFDPAHVDRNGTAPPVQIEEIIGDQKRYEPRSGLRFPAHTRDLEFNFTALSFRVPQRVRFRSWLEGRDTEWQDRGARRQAVYTDLRAGEYRFRVIASNDDQMWNDVGAQLRFSIAPAWYQTLLARTSAVVIVFACGVLLYRWRVRQLAAVMTAGFDERLLERTRIAQDLHDTFLQTLQGSKLLADHALDPSTDHEHRRHALERLSLWIGQAMLEARAALNSIRDSIAQPTNLADDLRRAAEDAVACSSTSVSFSVSGVLPELHPIVRDEVSAIGSEAIRNALAHAHSEQLLVTLAHERDLVLRVQDNGVGIDPTMLSGGKDGHFGLRGMRERAARIGAKLTIMSAIGTGTDVTLIVPRSVAFKNGFPVRRRFKRALERPPHPSRHEE
jgi:signal transduction histidine kinase/ligand-binding sensor domain-containing protein